MNITKLVALCFISIHKLPVKGPLMQESYSCNFLRPHTQNRLPPRMYLHYPSYLDETGSLQQAIGDTSDKQTRLQLEKWDVPYVHHTKRPMYTYMYMYVVYENNKRCQH